MREFQSVFRLKVLLVFVTNTFRIAFVPGSEPYTAEANTVVLETSCIFFTLYLIQEMGMR